MSPGGLNIVLQGASAGVAEMTPDEKRKMIEGVVGIAKFDERKAEALRTLNAADQKIEVAMARIGEQRSVLESLDSQRNDLVRYNLLAEQINWLEAVQTSRRIRDLQERISALKGQEQQLNAKVAELNQRHADFENRVTDMEKEKNKFITEVVQGGGSSHLEIGDQLRGLNAEIDGFRDDLQKAEATVRELEESTVPNMREAVSTVRKEVNASESLIRQLTDQADRLTERQKDLTFQLKEYFRAGEELRRTVERKTKNASRAQVRLAGIAEEQKDIELKIASSSYTLDANKKDLEAKKTSLDEYTQMLDNFESKTKELMELHEGSNKQLGSIDEDIATREAKKEELIDSIEAASRVLEKATVEVAKEEAFRKISDSLAGERKDQLKLQEVCTNGGVPGYVGRLGQLIKFPQSHTKAVNATMGRWLDAFIVEDLRSMTHLIKAAKSLKAKSYSVIPLSEVEGSATIKVETTAGIIGPLSSSLKCDREFQGLANFLAGDTVLVENEAVGYMAASEGVRAVTLEGDVFEQGGRAFIFGHRETLINLMEGLENIEGVTEIEDAVGALKSAISRRRTELQGLESESRTLTKERLRRVVDVTSLKAESTSYNAMAARYRGIHRNLRSQYDKKAKEVERDEVKLKLYAEKKEALAKGAGALLAMIEEVRSLGLESMLAEIDTEKQSLNTEIDDLRNRVSEASMKLSVERARLENELQQKLSTNEQDFSAAQEDLEQNRQWAREAPKKIKELEEQKNELETKYNKLMDSSKNSQPVLDEFDAKIRRLREERDSVSRSVNERQKEVFAVSSQIESTQEKIEEASGSLRILGFAKELEVFEEADKLLAQLKDEYGGVSSAVNKGADRQYSDMYLGYKNLSTRHNELEKEKLSIIQFIESVDAEKKKVFMSAFEKIHSEFKTIFNRLTGGDAWLELENPDDIFSGGLRLMARFGTKPPWESLSLSGGEKAVSGVSLILAMQGVQPQPFYLFDEVDSPLDAVNSENLAGYLRERSISAQIVAMSLRDVFVAHSTMTYGVFSTGGISRVVHYKPAEVPAKIG
jgi:chromosome segregation protein